MLRIFETLEDTCAFDILVLTLNLMDDRSKVSLKEWPMMPYADTVKKFWQILLEMSKMDAPFLREALTQCGVDLGAEESFERSESVPPSDREPRRIPERRD